MKVSIQFDRVSQPTPVQTAASTRGSSFAQTMSMVADEKTAERTVAAEHRVKKESVDKKAERTKSGDAPAAFSDQGTVKDTTRPIPVTQSLGGSPERKTGEDATSHGVPGFKAAIDQVASAPQPVAASTIKSGDQVQNAVQGPAETAGKVTASTPTAQDATASSADDTDALSTDRADTVVDGIAGQPVSGQPVSGQPVSGQPVSGQP